MDDTLQNNAGVQSMTALYNHALELGKILDDHHGSEVVIMDMRPLNFWTDFFIIATVSSNTHLSGLERHIKDFVSEHGLEILHRSRKPEKGAELQSEEWCLLDLGGIVIHLMTARVRSFFELERLWSAAPLIFRKEDSIRNAGSESHSSKSS
jgi:ribosome-associated protein